MATANPEDYTNRGRIITPLKDRFQAQIKTHYPKTQDHEISIMEQEARILHRDGYYVKVPKFIKQIIAEFTFQARSSHEINQRSGVSVRTTIANYETIMANAEKRAITMGEREVAPRITDFPAIIPSTAGKIELEYLGDDKSEVVVIENLMKRAIKVVFDSYFPSLDFFPELLSVLLPELLPCFHPEPEPELPLLALGSA